MLALVFICAHFLNLVSSQSSEVLLNWNFYGQSNFGASPLSVTTQSPNIYTSGFIRAPGVKTDTTAVSNSFGGNGFSSTTAANAVTNLQYIYFSVSSLAGSVLSLSKINAGYNFRTSSSGPTSGIWQYQVGLSSFVNLGNVKLSAGTSAGVVQSAIDLSSISELQSLREDDVVTFRLVLYGGAAGGTFYFYEPTSDNSNFMLSGFIENGVPSPDRTLRPSMPTRNPTLAPPTTKAPTKAPVTSSGKMICGTNVTLCGLLVLESGYGPNKYNHIDVGVHGLWPEVGQYGTSLCVAPTSTANPTVVYSCYDAKDVAASENLSFEVHEWTAHGVCAGVVNEKDFFTQVCDLSSVPLSIMSPIRQAGGSLDEMANALAKAGYEIFTVDPVNSQVELTACATHGGRWMLSPVADFTRNCGL